MDNLHARMGQVPEGLGEQPVAPPPQVETRRGHPAPHSAPLNRATRMPRILVWVLVAIVVLAGLFGVWKLFLSGADDGISQGKYQAVFLTSSNLPSNVYFGKLQRLGDGYFRLTNVYYLQNPTDKTEQASTTLTVARMTKEAHSPTDELILPREQILYYQNMTDDSKVVQFIKQDSQKN